MARARCTFRQKVPAHDAMAHNKLITAVRCKDKVLVQQLIDKGVEVNGLYMGWRREFDPDVELYDHYNGKEDAYYPLSTPLHLAVMSRDIEIVNILLHKGANVNARVWNGEIPLMMAAKMQNILIIDLLLIQDSLKNAVDFDELSHLHIACMRNKTKVVKKLLLMNQGDGIDESVHGFSLDWTGYTALHFAVHYQCVETVHILLNCGASIKELDKRRRSPLHLAYNNRNEEIIDFIFKFHKNEFKNPTNVEGLSHFHIACTRDDISIVEHFLKSGNEQIYDLFLGNIDYEMTNRSYTKLSALHDACIQNRYGKVGKMLFDGEINIPSDLNRPIWNGWTALHLAVNYESEMSVRALLEYGASVVIQDPEGRTPLHLAFRNESHEGLFVLGMPDKKLASNVEKIFALVAGDELLTVSYFHLACTSGLFNLIKSTLDNVANNPELKNSYLCSLNDLGQTPLHSVILLNMTKDTSQIVELLLKNGADVHVKDFELQTPLHCAQVDLDPEISYLLVNHGANVNARNVFREKPLVKLLRCIKKNCTSENPALPLAPLLYAKVSLLLEGGSNINITDRAALTCRMVIPDIRGDELWKGIACILLKRAIKLRVIGHRINESDKKAYRSILDNLKKKDFDEAKFAESCKNELEVMKNVYIDRYTSLYSILRKSLNSLTLHLRCQFDNGEIRQPLLVESRKSLNLIFCPLLPAQYVDTILDYLSNEDLENIIKSR
ncbi:hypothetical protein QAD02_011305 [Eretmocerus hayati]|uniref:Uncharacterized protein n=1 Tax=Eretmocerus hayati TaxID=131215 RepID=A0ACC2NW69_9HYME|nr:hypothetical protein QAD02_011305 [Eretmocerus hayati]